MVEALGGGGRIPVRATFDGVPYQGSVVSMGGQKIIGLLKDIRLQLNKTAGDKLGVTLEADHSERVVTVPEDLRVALAEAALSGQFAALSYSHQREHVKAIEEAKRPETRARRINQVTEALRPGSP